VWFCSSCDNGPIPTIQNVCVMCSHQMCGSCRVEDPYPPVPDYNRPPTQFVPNAEENEHHQESRSDKRKRYYRRNISSGKAPAQTPPQQPARLEVPHQRPDRLEVPHQRPDRLEVPYQRPARTRIRRQFVSRGRYSHSPTTNLFDLPRLNKTHNTSDTFYSYDEDNISTASTYIDSVSSKYSVATSATAFYSYDEDNISTASTYVDSVSSKHSVATSATAFSVGSGFSFEQIKSATQLFVSILQNDELLAPLYESARRNSRVGSNRLRRHIRGAIKRFAEHLREEANDDLQHAASRLVQAKAHYAAQFIASGEGKKDQLPSPKEPHDQTSNDLGDSSEEETADWPVDHTVLEDLEAFHLFLTGSGAYTTLQADIHAFCTRKSISPPRIAIIDHDLELKSLTAPKEKRTWYTLLRRPLSVCSLIAISTVAAIVVLGASIISRGTVTLTNTNGRYGLFQSSGRIRLARVAAFLMTDVVFPLTDNLFMALGLLEPPLKVGWTRIRTECVSLLYSYR